MEHSTEELPTNTSLYIYDNATENATFLFTSHVPKFSAPVLIVICIFLGAMILATILGNVFVITAILIEKSLQGVSNYLILSLGVTDLMVAVLVMPLSLVNEVSMDWFLGGEVCDMWISMDVLLCTASILHLVAISLDRFWAVNNVDYIRRRCARQILTMVLVVWLVAVTISIPPLFGWKEDVDPNYTGQCLISQDKGYTIFSTVGAFFFPMALMLGLNYKIYMAARFRIRKKKFGGRPRPVQVPVVQVDVNTQNPSRNSSGSDVSQDGFSMYNGSCVNMNEISRVESTFEGPEETQNGNGFHTNNGLLDPNLAPNFGTSLTVPGNVYVLSKNKSNNNSKRARNREKDKLRKEKIEMRRERKAARVLGIITGAFVVCWLPFFTIAIVAPFCTHCIFHPAMMGFFLWLGYFNSLLNPIIYTIFNPSFRTAFRKIFFRRMRLVNR